MNGVTLLRYLWAAPATVLGLMFAVAALRHGRVTVVDAVIEVHGPLLRWALSHLAPGRSGVAAITFGHVVLGRDAQSLDCARSHERVHVRQYERWGAFFLPAYVAASAWAFVQGGHPYFDNRFEREARAKAYRPKAFSTTTKNHLSGRSSDAIN
jgi:hypothetical protein